MYTVQYEIDVIYVATLRNLANGQTFRIKGRWKGKPVDVSDITYQVINLGTGNVVSTYSAKQKMFL